MNLKQKFVVKIFKVIEDEVNSRDIRKSYLKYGIVKGRKGLIYILDIGVLIEIYMVQNEKTGSFRVVIEPVENEVVQKGVTAIAEEITYCHSRVALRNSIIRICDIIGYVNVIFIKDYTVLVDMYKGTRTYQIVSERGILRDKTLQRNVPYTPEDAYVRGDIEVFGRNIFSDIGIFVKDIMNDTYNAVREKLIHDLGE